MGVHATGIRILAVDQNSLLREGLSLLIRLQSDMELVDAVASAEEGVQSFMRHRPDVILMDIDLPLAAGVQAIRRIIEIDPLACLLALSTYEEDDTRRQAMRAGARTCLAKDRLNKELIPLVRSFHSSPGSRPPSE